MSKTTQRTAESLNSVISNFLKKYKCFNENHSWEVRESPIGGFGVFAKQDIDAGEVIFEDYPVIIGPRSVPDCPLICVVCFRKSNLQGCSRNCGLPICSEVCQNSKSHLEECKIIVTNKKDCNNNKATAGSSSETVNHNLKLKKDNKETMSRKLFNNFTPVRALLLDIEDKEVVASLTAHQSDQHGKELDVLKDDLKLCFPKEDEDFMRFVCCVMDANAFEVTTGGEENQSSVRGLYPLGSLANHRCYPNATHVFDNQQKMVCRAAVFIPKDAEIFHSYSRIIWGSVTRLFHLKRTKHFICKCERCEDPTEFGTYMSAILCKLCRGNVIPINPYKAHARWQCEDCKIFITGQEVGQLLKMLGSILRNIQPSNFELMHSFLKGKLSTVVPQTSQVAVELKYKIIWLLGYKPGYKWEDLSIELLNLKKDLCEGILNLLTKLKTGQSKMRGLLLYELYRCNREILKRSCGENNDMINIFEEAQKILKDDVLAPEELKT